MEKVRGRSNIIMAVFFVIITLAWSCGGGGGGGGGSTSPTLTPARMDQGTAENAAAISMVGSDLSSFTGGLVDDFVYDRMTRGAAAPTTISLGDWALKKAREAFLAGNITRETEKSRSGTISESGGCYSVTGNWTGPNETEDPCDISDATLTMRFDGCQEGGMSINGSMTITIGGVLCLPESVSVQFRNFSMADDTSGLAVECENFRMAMTELQYTNQNLEELTHSKVTLNGDIAMDSFNLEFYRYVEDMTYSGAITSVMLNGSFTGMCLDGWVTLTTLSPILVSDSSECPYSGSIQLSGTSDVLVTIYSDGSMTIGDQDYESCRDLPAACQ